MVLPMNIDSAIDQFISDKTVYCAPATIEYYKNMMHRFYLFLTDGHPITDTEDINVNVLKNYASFLRFSVKSTSIHTYFRGVKNFCAWGILNGFIPPFDYHIRLPRPDPEQTLPLSTEEVNKCLSYIREYCINSASYELLFRFMLDCGMRSSEALSLKWSDIDREKNIIFINYSKYDKSRMVPLPPVLLGLLDQIKPTSDTIFDIDRSGKFSFFARMKKQTGIDRLHAHLLRKTFATSYMVKVGNLEYLRMYLGHADYSVTKVYIGMSYQCRLLRYDIYKIDDVFV